MKKRKKTDEQKKEATFKSTPFKALKGYAPEPVSMPPEPAAQSISAKETRATADEERSLFLQHMADVQRLGGSSPSKRQVPVEEKPVVPEVDREESKIFLEALTGMDVSFRDEFPELEPARPLAVNRLRQLRTGAIRIDLELDLHGLTREEALVSLAHFIMGAYNRAQKAVLVITGKGNNSPGEPVLQGAVSSWLREAGKGMVAEFAPAPRQMGGSGAFVVFLKERNS